MIQLPPVRSSSAGIVVISGTVLAAALLWVVGITPLRTVEGLAMLVAVDVVLGVAVLAIGLVSLWFAVRRKRARRAWTWLVVGSILVAGAFVARPAAQGLSSRSEPMREPVISFLSWNAQGVDPGGIASRVLPVIAERNVAVLVLPETGGAVAQAVSEALRLAGWSHSLFEREATSVFIQSTLAEAKGYRVEDGNPPWAGLQVSPRSPSSSAPVIVAVHVQQPSPGNHAVRESHLQWIEGICHDREYVVALGDFNSTPNHLINGGLGRCADVALANGNGAASTWPTWLPAWLGISLDRAMVGPPFAADGMGFEILRSFDVGGSPSWGSGRGADHWPIVLEVTTRE